MTAEIIQLRDYKRREEQEAQLQRLADQIFAEALDCAPCELPGVWPDFYHAPDRDPA